MTSMRWPIIRTLVHKEARRLAANRGALVLVALLVVAALLLSAFDRGGVPSLGGPSAVRRFWVDYWLDGAWVQHLRQNMPAELAPLVRFRSAASIPADRAGTLQYAPGEAAVQLRPDVQSRDPQRFKVWFWYAGDDPSVLTPYEDWFWRETRRFHHELAIAALPIEKQADGRRIHIPPAPNDLVKLAAEVEGQYRERFAVLASPGQPLPFPDWDVERSALRLLDIHRAVAVALVLFSLFFACVYLQSSLTCEERERGVLLAQALSPASPADILAAKALFYTTVGVGLAATLGGICHPGVLIVPFFWLALAAAAAGSLGLGMSIACLARTQREASMTALGYTLAIALLIFVCAQNRIPFLPGLLIEYHLPRMLQAALAGTVQLGHWLSLAATVGLAAGWIVLAFVLFRRRGWQ